MTLREKPRWSRRANSWALLASQGVYLRSAAKGNTSLGPNTWQCASTLPGGSLNAGLLGPAYQSSQPGVFSNAMSGQPPHPRLPLRKSVDVPESRLLQRSAHVVHVQSKYAGRQLTALFFLAGGTRGGSLRDGGGHRGRNDNYAIVITYDNVARIYYRAGADHRNVHRSESGLDCALRADRPAPHRELHRR